MGCAFTHLLDLLFYDDRKKMHCIIGMNVVCSLHLWEGILVNGHLRSIEQAPFALEFSENDIRACFKPSSQKLIYL